MTWSSSPEPDPAGVSGASGRRATAELRVGGMHCGSCAELIREVLDEQAGVASAAVDLESARAVVEYDPALVGPEQLRAAIADVGYTAAVDG